MAAEVAAPVPVARVVLALERVVAAERVLGERAAVMLPGAPLGGSRGLTPNCPQGYVSKGGSCLHASSGVLPDAELYQQGRALALTGYYAHALPILEAVVRTDDPIIYTMRGYAVRKLGDHDTAMRLYDRALTIEPDNINTHEYIGKSYVELRKPDLARAELAKVAKFCGLGCEQYDDLAEAIKTGRTE